MGAGERNQVDENSMHRFKGTTGMAGSCFSNYSLLGGFALGGHGIRQGTQGPGDEQVELHYVCHSHLADREYLPHNPIPCLSGSWGLGSSSCRRHRP